MMTHWLRVKRSRGVSTPKKQRKIVTLQRAVEAITSTERDEGSNYTPTGE